MMEAAPGLGCPHHNVQPQKALRRGVKFVLLPAEKWRESQNTCWD
jgi:hypothetical protein